MLVILSPAKNMHRVPTPPPDTRPMFLQQTETLAASMKRYAPFQLESVLKVNPQLALRAFTDIQDWNASIPGSPALLRDRKSTRLNSSHPSSSRMPSSA